MSKLSELIEQKFTSGNDVPVERISITRAEYESCIENAEKYTDVAPCAQKTAELSDDEIIAAANGWREYDAPDGLSLIPRMVYGACRAVIAADRKLRGDA